MITPAGGTFTSPTKVKLDAGITGAEIRYTIDGSARGFLLAGASEAAVGDVVNIGSGSDIAISGVIEEVNRILGRETKVVLEENRLRPGRSEVLRLLCDRRKAQGLIGWAPTVNFTDGLRRTVDWVAEHPEMYPTSAYAV